MARQGERALGRHEARVYLNATMRRGRFYLVEVEHIAHATQVVAAPARVGAARSKAEGGRVRSMRPSTFWPKTVRCRSSCARQADCPLGQLSLAMIASRAGHWSAWQTLAASAVLST